MDTTKNVAELVRKLESDYISGTTSISKYVNFSLYENIEKIYAYINSKHISGETDSLGREKPFFNICTAAINVWYRATDIDRKNIRIKPTKSGDTMLAFLANVHLQNYMKSDDFGTFLNEWGRVMARFGSAISKHIENDEGLHSMVIPWNRIIIDSIDFENNPKIEILELTPAQLKKRKGYDQKVVDALIDTVSARKLIGGQTQDTKTGFIRLYEIHGELPLSLITGKEKDDNEYVQQMHVVSFVQGKNKGEFDDFCLYSGKEKEDPYVISHLIKEDGRSQSIGAVEHLFETQWMQNHTAKAIKDQLDIASKLMFQTSDQTYVGRNALLAVESGDILTHALNQPLTQINNGSHDISSLQSFAGQWKSLGNEITGISESMLGVTPPSGTAWRQTNQLLQESHSLFELMIENKGLALENIIKRYVLPYLKKKMDTSEEISATLESYDIDKIDTIYARNKAIIDSNKKILEDFRAGKVPEMPDLEADQQSIKSNLAQNGAQRFFSPSDIDDTTWKELLKDLEMDVEIEITNENTDRQSRLATIDTILRVMSSNPQVFETPRGKLLFNAALNETGVVSPLEINNTVIEQPVQQLTPKEIPSIVPQGGI